MNQTTLLSTVAECYREYGVAADLLPYTDQFENLWQEVLNRTGANMTRAEFWHILVNARKRGVLPRLVR
jgi:hypothetical protein